MFGNIEGRRKRLRVVNRIGWKEKRRKRLKRNRYKNVIY